MNKTRISLAAGLFVLLLLGMAAWLGSYPLMQPDEGRNAEVAREMVASGDYLVPHLNGLPYVDKPVLHYAVTAVAMRILGVNEFAARLPSLLATLLTALVVGGFGSRLWKPEVGWTAAALLLACPLAFAMAHVVILDAVLMLLLVIALISFYFAVELRAAEAAGQGLPQAMSRGSWRRWSIAGWIAIGLGILTKGPVALLIPPLVALPYAYRRRAMGAVVYPPAVVLGVALVVPWVMRMSEHLPDYLHYVVVTETWKRISSDALHRSQPFWYFVPVLLVGAFPWSVMLLARAWRTRKIRWWPSDPRVQYLVLWIVLPFVFFSLSRSKLPHYMLPLLPSVALLAAVVLCGDEREPVAGRTIVGVLWLILGAAFVGAGLLVHPPRDIDPDLMTAARGLALAVGSVALLAGWLGLWLRPSGARLAVVYSLPVLCLGLADGPLMKAVGETRSAHRLALAIEQQVPGERTVVGVGAYPTALPFYLESTMYVSSTNGREFTSNYVLADHARLQRAPDSTLRDADWWRVALTECRSPTVFVTDVDDDASAKVLLQAGLPRIAADRKFAAYGPCRPHANGMGTD